MLPTNPYQGRPPDSRWRFAGATGWEVDDTGQFRPLNRYVALPYRNGALLITAYKGPGIDLTPFLAAMLPSLRLMP